MCVFFVFFLCTCKVSRATQRTWRESKAAAGLAISRFEGTDSLAEQRKKGDQRLYRQVTPDSYSYSYSGTVMLLG